MMDETEKALWEVLAEKAQQGQTRAAEIIKAADAVNRRHGLPSLAEEAKEAEKAKEMSLWETEEKM